MLTDEQFKMLGLATANVGELAMALNNAFLERDWQAFTDAIMDLETSTELLRHHSALATGVTTTDNPIGQNWWHELLHEQTNATKAYHALFLTSMMIGRKAALDYITSILEKGE